MATTISAGTNPYKLGSPPDFGTLYSGRALEFDGATDYILIDSDNPAGMGSNPYSISAWVKFNDVTTHDTSFAYFSAQNQGNSQPRFGIWLSTLSSVNRINIVMENSGDDYSNAFILSTDTNWHYYVFVEESDTSRKFYKDGLLVNTDTTDYSLSTSYNDFSIGATYSTSAGYHLDGGVSNIQVWDKAWSLSDVQYAYTHPERLITHNSAVTSGTTISNLKAWYPCTEGNPRSPQTTVYDGSPKELGSDIVVDGDFPSTDNWTDFDAGGWSLVDGVATHASSGGTADIKQEAALGAINSGDVFKITADITKTSVGGYWNVFIGGTDATGYIDDTGSVVKYLTINAGSPSRYILFYGDGDWDGTVDNLVIKKVQMGNHGTTTFYGDELLTNDDTNWDSTGAFTGWTYYDDGTNGGAGTLKQDGLSLIGGRTYSLTFVLAAGNNMGIEIKSYDDSETFVAEATYANSSSHTVTFTPSGDESGIMLNVDDSVDGACNLTTASFSLKEVGVATGWTTADAEPLIPQTALMGMSKPMVFDDVDDYVDLGDVAIGGQSSITVSAWIIRTGYSDSSAVRNGCINKDNDLECWVRVNSEDVLGMGINNTHYSSDYELPADGWHHVVWTWVGGSPSTIKWYVDGALVDTESGPSAATISNTASALYLGSRGGSYRLKGNMNEVSIWHNKAFTLAEVQELFNDGVALDATTHSASSDLVGYWRNDGASSWSDRSTNSNDGTVAGSPETILLPEGTTSGKDILGFPLTHTNNGWLNLSGSEYIPLPISSVLDFVHTFSVEAWVKNDSASTSGREHIVAKYKGDSGERIWRLYILGDNIYFACSEDGSTGGTEFEEISGSITPNQWNHVVCTFNNGVMTIYKNGASLVTEDESSDFTSVHVNTSRVIEIGSQDTSNFWNGSIDEVRVYNRALSVPEITKNYKHGKGKHPN